MRCVAFVLFIILHVKNGRGECLDTVSRQEWGGAKAVKVDYIIIPVENVIIHHTVTPECATEEACTKRLRSIQNYFLNTLKYHDMGYNFLIGGDGRVYEGVGWHKLGAHTKGWNTRSIGIALIGNFQDYAPKENQLQALKDLLECGVATGELASNYSLLGARQVRNTLSPGEKLFSKIKTWPHFVNNP